VERLFFCPIRRRRLDKSSKPAAGRERSLFVCCRLPTNKKNQFSAVNQNVFNPRDTAGLIIAFTVDFEHKLAHYPALRPQTFMIEFGPPDLHTDSGEAFLLIIV